jgi:Ca2+-binding EF-hand superfamily protein
MKTLLFSAVALCALAGIAPALAAEAPAPQQSRHEMKPMTRAAMMQMVQERFAKLDTNKDGFITQAEMDAGRTAMRERTAERMKQRESTMFDRMDANHDGEISRAEFDSAHNAMAARMDGMHGMQMGMDGMHMRMRMMHAGMAGHMFAAADTNKDGRVSLQEATAAGAAHFDRLDTNHDGTVTPDEMRAAHKAMRGPAGKR